MKKIILVATLIFASQVLKADPITTSTLTVKQVATICNVPYDEAGVIYDTYMQLGGLRESNNVIDLRNVPSYLQPFIVLLWEYEREVYNSTHTHPKT